MGHERLGLLPKTQKWRQIVQRLSDWAASGESVAAIAADTLRNVRSRLDRLARDPGATAAFRFLVSLAGSCRQSDPRAELERLGVKLGDGVSALALAREVKRCVQAAGGDAEYSALALRAAVDAITYWYARHGRRQGLLFPTEEDPFEIWRRAATGRGFCELTREFFSSLTRRYLCYFLDREASACLSGVEERERFHWALQESVQLVSQHAFETARITQSFAAGWFNKHVVRGLPEEGEVRKFFAFCLKKMREELAREGAAE